MSRISRSVALAFALFLVAGSQVSAQRAPDPPQKDVTDGFFDVPAQEDPDGGKGNPVKGYLVTSIFAGAALFALCKSARR